MNLKILEQNISIIKKISAIFGFDDIEVHVASVDIRTACNNDSVNFALSVGIREKFLRKIANIGVTDYHSNKRCVLLSYSKKPENTVHTERQHPTKEDIFNKNLTMNIPITSEELSKIEDILDEVEDKIYISLEFYTA